MNSLLPCLLLAGLFPLFGYAQFPTTVGTSWHYVSYVDAPFFGVQGPEDAFTDVISEIQTHNGVDYAAVVRDGGSQQ